MKPLALESLAFKIRKSSYDDSYKARVPKPVCPLQSCSMERDRLPS